MGKYLSNNNLHSYDWIMHELCTTCDESMNIPAGKRIRGGNRGRRGAGGGGGGGLKVRPLGENLSDVSYKAINMQYAEKDTAPLCKSIAVWKYSKNPI